MASVVAAASSSASCVSPIAITGRRRPVGSRKRASGSTQRRHVSNATLRCRGCDGDGHDDQAAASSHTRRDVLLAGLSAATVGSWFGDAEALAFGGEIALTNVRYETAPCPLNQYMPNKKNTVCMLFTATAENNLKRKVEAANVFGFVDDQQNNSAATVNPTGTSRTVLAGVDSPIPPGTSEVTFIVTIFKDSLDLGELKLRGFKAVPSLDDIEQRFKPFSECDVDPEAEGCPNAL